MNTKKTRNLRRPILPYRRIFPRATAAAFVCSLSLWAPPALHAGDIEGANVVSGQAAINQIAPNITNITASDRAIIEYQKFNISNQATVNFLQPSANATVLNRIIGNSPSMLNGTLNANGHVYFVNPAGVYFGANSVINAARFHAAAGNISNEDFSAGIDRFTATGNLTNEGIITANDGVYLIGQQVNNTGSIVATNGLVSLSSGDTEYVADGDSRVLVKVDSLNTADAGRAAESDVAGTGVSNSGIIDADEVIFSSGDIYSLAVKNAGSITATGDVTLASSGDVENTGNIEAGDDVTIAGDHATLAEGSITAGNRLAVHVNHFQLGGEMSAGNEIYLDPANLTVVSGNEAFDIGQDEVGNTWVNDQLDNGTNVTLSASESITVDAAIASTNNVDSNTLHFDDTDDNTLTINLNDTITLGINQTLTGEGITVNVADTGLIQNGLDVAGIGQTVNVAAGNYVEDIQIFKPVTLRGANADVAWDFRGPESTIAPLGSGQTPIRVYSSDVSINGFEITGSLSNNAIWHSNGTLEDPTGRSNLSYTFNHIHDIGTTRGSGNIKAIQYLTMSDATSDITISDNVFENIGNATSLAGHSTAIYFGQSNSTGTVTNLNIERNVIRNVEVTNVSKTSAGIEIGTGWKEDIGGGYVENLIIRGNDISDISGGKAVGILLGGNTPGAVVSYNTVDNITSTATTPLSAAVGIETNTGAESVSIHDNSLTGALYSLYNTTDAVVVADNNYWGDATGPNMALATDDTQNPHGLDASGGAVVGNVTVDSWLATSTTTTENHRVTTSDDLAHIYAYSDTIKGGIDAATAGDTVTVTAGVFDEGIITINTDNVTILGAQAGVDARTRDAIDTTDETVINGNILVNANVDGATIDGVFIQNIGVVLGESVGVYINNNASNTTVENTYILGEGQDVNRKGIVSSSAGSTNNTFTQNVYDSLETAVYLNPSAFTTELSDSLIVDSRYGYRLISTTDTTISGNQFLRSGGMQIRAGWSASPPANEGLVIENNDFTGLAGTGLEWVGYIDAQDGAVANGQIDISNNTFEGIATDAMTLDQLFAVEDLVHHAVDGAAGGAYSDGTVYLQANTLFVSNDATSSIDNAVVAASTGDTIQVNSGTFVENVTVDKNVNIIGAGSAGSASTIIDADGGNGIVISGSGNSEADRLTISGLTVNDASNGIRINSTISHVALSDVVVDTTGSYGINFNTGTTTDFVIDNSSFTTNGVNVGLKVGTSASVDGLTVTDSHFDGNKSGWYVGTNSSGTTEFTNISVSDTTFNNSTGDGLYIEKLDNASFDNITVSGTANTGMKLNLKYEAYDNVSITNSTFTNNGLVGNQGALTFMVRDDGSSYASNPATLTNSTVSGNVFDGNYVNANFQAASGLSVNGNSFINATSGTNVSNWHANELDASANWWGSTDMTTVANGLSGLVDYSPMITTGVDADTNAAGFQAVTAEVIVHAVGAQTDGLIQEGVDLVDIGGTVDVLAGTYAGNFTIDKSVNLLGANKDVDPTSLSDDVRGAESIIQGKATIKSDDIVVNGFTFTDYTSQAFYVQSLSDNVTLSYNLIDNTNSQAGAIHINPAGSFSEPTTGVTNFNILNNKIQAPADNTDMIAIQISSPTNIQHDGITISGNEISGGAESLYAVFAQSINDITISNNYIHDMHRGINMDEIFNSSVTGNLIERTSYHGMLLGMVDSEITNNTFQDIGHYLDSGSTLALGVFGSAYGATNTSNLSISGNVFDVNTNADAIINGVLIFTGADVATIHFNENKFINNQAHADAYLFANYYGATDTVDASGNWWDTTNPTLLPALTDNARTIEVDGEDVIQLTGPVDFGPMLASGTDLDGNVIGFQADASHVIVHALGTQSGTVGVIAEGLAVTGVSQVDVAGGTYSETVTLDDAAITVTYLEDATIGGLNLHNGTMSADAALTVDGDTVLDQDLAAQGVMTFDGTVSLGVSDVALTASDIEFTGGDNSVTGSGNLTLTPFNTASSIGVGDDAASSTDDLVNGDFHIDTQDYAAIADGFASRTFGNIVNGTGVITVGNIDIPDPTTFATPGETPDDDILVYGSVVIEGDGKITFMGDYSTTRIFGSITTGSTFTGAGQDIITTNDHLILENTTVNTGGGNIVSAGDVTLNDSSVQTGGGSFNTQANLQAEGAATIDTTGASGTAGALDIAGNVTGDNIVFESGSVVPTVGGFVRVLTLGGNLPQTDSPIIAATLNPTDALTGAQPNGVPQPGGNPAPDQNGGGVEPPALGDADLLPLSMQLALNEGATGSGEVDPEQALALDELFDNFLENQLSLFQETLGDAYGSYIANASADQSADAKTAGFYQIAKQQDQLSTQFKELLIMIESVETLAASLGMDSQAARNLLIEKVKPANMSMTEFDALIKAYGQVQ